MHASAASPRICSHLLPVHYCRTCTAAACSSATAPSVALPASAASCACATATVATCCCCATRHPTLRAAVNCGSGAATMSRIKVRAAATFYAAASVCNTPRILDARVSAAPASSMHAGLEQQLAAAQLSTHNNCWAQVFDFTPPAEGQPPNWVLLPPGTTAQQLLWPLPIQEAPGVACAQAGGS